MNKKLKISVVTVCKNSEKHIEDSIQSLVSQSFDSIEYIVIDGKSTDNTLLILEKYKKDISVLISETDNGIYHAMNKGIDQATGDIIYFLNSDDTLHDSNVISKVADEFHKDPQTGILYGNVVMTDGVNERLVKYENSLTKRYFYKNTICHQAIFAKKKIFTLIGKFNENYKIHADTDWLMRAYFNPDIRSKFQYADLTVSFFSPQGFCSNPVNAEKYKYDRQEISAKYFFEAKVKLFIKKVLMKSGFKL